MKKINSLQQLTLFAVLLLCCATAHAGSNYHFMVDAKVASTGGGKVYISKENIAPTDNQYALTCSTGDFEKESKYYGIYAFAKPDKGYGFLKWVNRAGEDRSKLANALLFSLKSESTKPLTTPIDVFTAHFVPTTVSVMVNDPRLGFVSIDKVANKVGDKVTITATRNPNNDSAPMEFLGWSNEAGDTVSHNLKYTFAINKADVYTANFKLKHTFHGEGYYRLKHIWGGALNVVGSYSKGSTQNQDGVLKWMPSNNSAFYSSPGTVLKLTGEEVDLQATAPNTVVMKNSILASQGVDTKNIAGDVFEVKTGLDLGFFKFIKGAAALKKLDEGQIYIGLDKVYIGEDRYSYFALEPLDEEHVDEYYFGAQPGSTVVDGKYYTTMYTAFPYECYQPDGVKAYIVTAIDATKGTIHIKNIESGKVPANTPVILECNGKTAKENRLIPLMTEPEAIVGNLLKGKINLNTLDGIRPEYKLLAFNAATMRVLSDTELAFVNKNTGDSSNILSNTCYLDISQQTEMHDKYVIVKEDDGKKTLEQLVADASITGEVEIKDDDLSGVYVHAESKRLFAKDDGKFSPAQILQAGEINFLNRNLDQSNWLEIQLPATVTVAQMKDLVGHSLKGLKGTLTRTGENLTLTVEQLPVAGVQKPYNPNVYITCSFNGTQQKNGKTYFFVQPKPNEYAFVTWSQWNSPLNAFVVPVGKNSRGEVVNESKLEGGYFVDMNMCDQYTSNMLVDGKIYDDMPVIIKKENATSSRNLARRAVYIDQTAVVAQGYMVYPLRLPQGHDISTAIEAVEVDRQLVAVKYYNMQGMESDQPFSGINVKVNVYSDGSRTSSKINVR